ncbi:hypothetical protein OnM2_016032 [Erysiphe neolycopersici]|uniref:DRBM domain-containing protein n=1 Tax=Erysiphe neolycopersici TaxID=212602 RepID=A0A420I4V8_9PEZI|nr:hypothetical protein OnM2_016032 [Erysiphe neolycopersici]
MAGKYQIHLENLCIHYGWPQPIFVVKRLMAMFKCTVIVAGKDFLSSEDYCQEVAKEDAAKQAYNYFNDSSKTTDFQ